MNILSLVSSNSGSTFAANQIVNDALIAAGHTVTVKNPKEASPDELTQADAVVLASPSWDYETKEGQPHEDFFPLLKELEGKTIEGKPFAILGLGDTSYTHFCGAVDVFESVIASIKGKLVVASLKIDKFYQNSESTNLVKSWAETLAKSLIPS